MPTIVAKSGREAEGCFYVVEEGETLVANLGGPSDGTCVHVKPHPKKPGHKITVDGRVGPHVGPHWRETYELRCGVVVQWVSDRELQGLEDEPAP